MACYEIQPIPNKGNGLVATYDIAPGTRILSEKPLFTVPAQAEATMDFYIIAKAKLLTKDEQRQFLSLHNSHQDKNIFRSIFETNALPCGPGSTTGAVYPTICLINHSCAPNSYVSWNSDARSQTIHALRNIGVGEEITISYYHPNKTFRKRQTYLKEHFKFDCACEVCSLPLTDRKQSDVRRLEIEELDEVFFTPGRTVLKPEAAMLDRYKLLQLLEEEYKGSAKVFESDAYEELVQLCISRGDEARASVFAERAYKTRVVCTGEDGVRAQEFKRLIDDPSKHQYFGMSQVWKSKKNGIPKGLNEKEFEKWLWRQK